MDNSKSPATKADIQNLHDVMKTWKTEIQSDVSNWKTDLEARMDKWAVELQQTMAAHHEETMRHMDALMETFTADIRGASQDEVQVFKDRQGDHDGRIRRLEVHAGLAA